MKKIISRAYIAVALSLLFCGCLKDHVNLPDQNTDNYNQLYMPQAVNATVPILLAIDKGTLSAIYGVNYGGLGYPSSDISVQFDVSQQKADQYNTDHGTQYPLFPAAAFSLETQQTIIKAHSLASAPLHITLNGDEASLVPFQTYILPLAMTTDQLPANVSLNQQLSTAYYLITTSLDFKDYPDFDRSAWTVASFSSEETSGEGANNGKAIYAIDNNINTYWHTRYSDNFANPPHFLTVDLHELKTIHGFSLICRQNENRGRPQKVSIKTSVDGTTFTEDGTYPVESTNDQQKFFLTGGFPEARYVQLVITEMYDGATHTHLAEFGLF